MAFSGALIAAVANLLLLMILGLHDEKASWEERHGVERREEGAVCPPGYVPAGSTTTTTTAVGASERKNATTATAV